MCKGKSAHNGTADGFACTKGQVVYRRRYYMGVQWEEEEEETVPKNG